MISGCLSRFDRVYIHFSYSPKGGGVDFPGRGVTISTWSWCGLRNSLTKAFKNASHSTSRAYELCAWWSREGKEGVEAEVQEREAARMLSAEEMGIF